MNYIYLWLKYKVTQPNGSYYLVRFRDGTDWTLALFAESRHAARVRANAIWRSFK